MAHARTAGVVLSGVAGSLVDVEVDISAGLPSVGVVGLPDTSVAEARWRVRSAFASIGATWPAQRVTVSLAPAEVRKLGAGLDLPIAIAILKASEQLPEVNLERTVFVGELGLDGHLRAVRGALAGVLAARRDDRVIVPVSSLPEIGADARVGHPRLRRWCTSCGVRSRGSAPANVRRCIESTLTWRMYVAITWPATVLRSPQRADITSPWWVPLASARRFWPSDSRASFRT
jgi:Subunit ChlI of Mg-chelatase